MTARSARQPARLAPSSTQALAEPAPAAPTSASAPQKPLTNKDWWPQSLELAALMAKFGHVRLMVGLVLRYAPMYRDLRAALAEGKLGQVVSIEAAEHIEP